MALQVVLFKITGKGSILMNNPASIETKTTTTRTKTPLKESEAEKKLYINDDGTLYVPAMWFWSSLWEGASYEKIGKDAARNRIQTGVFVIEDRVSLLSTKTKKPIREYEIDSRWVVIKSTKGRIIRHRPKIGDWYCILPLEIDSDYINVDDVVKLFNKAGRVKGVGDYRIACKGPFGRFTCKKYKKASNGRKKKKL